MIVLGDSHTRAYGLNPHFTPVFLGPGKEVNFIDWERVDGLLVKCTQVAKVLQPESVVLCMGEPDTRYAMGLGWQPWNSTRPKDVDNYALLEKCTLRYLAFVRELSDQLGWTVYVQNIVLTQDSVQCAYINFYNERLAAELGERFIAFNDELRGANGAISEEFSWDMIHANNGICRFVESHLKLDVSSSALIPNEVMKSHFRKNARFNGLEFLEEKPKPFHRRLLSAMSRLTKGA